MDNLNEELGSLKTEVLKTLNSRNPSLITIYEISDKLMCFEKKDRVDFFNIIKKETTNVKILNIFLQATFLEDLNLNSDYEFD